uniref:Elongator complex protein 4 n=1 Tax=Tetradesmus obliquus TaxID=3088 RepID=A0A383WGU6_TETOB|eukprot:jgi/Sobl393_1/2735/SZX76717.1
MSAFIRRQPGAAGTRTPLDLGTRPGLHGQVLISTGLAGLDRLLGGGLSLGSILLLLEDSNTQQHLNLMKCFMAEGICCKHSVAWVTAQQLTPESTAAFLPDQARSGGSSSSSGQAAQQASSSSSTTTAAAAGSAAAPDDGLKIAWQYRKYIQSQQRAEPAAPDRSRTSSSSSTSSATGSSSSRCSSSSSAAKNVAAGIGREWCRQYDLTKGLTPAQLAGAKITTCCCTSSSSSSEASGAVAAAGAAAASFVQRFQPSGPIPVPSRDPGSIGRLVIQSLGSPDWWPSSSSSSSSLSAVESGIVSALAELRLQIQDATCAALVTCPAGLFSESFQARLQHLADAVLRIQCLADNTDVYRLLPDPTSASALLEVRRLPHLGLLRQRHTEDKLHLIRHKRRSISISVLDLLPLEAVEQQHSAADAAKKDVPAVAKICGSGAGKGITNVLDF